MSLKENIEMVKEELSSEEKFFEKAVVTERFVKKYKKPLIGLVVAVTLLVIGDIAYETSEQNRIEEANAVLLELEKNPKDTVLASKLQTLSAPLYDVWSYARAVALEDVKKFETLKSSKTVLMDDLASYEAAQLQADVKLLDTYAQKQDVIYKDLALIEEAVLLLEKGEIQTAHLKLSAVRADSSLYPVVQALMHYGVK